MQVHHLLLFPALLLLWITLYFSIYSLPIEIKADSHFIEEPARSVRSRLNARVFIPSVSSESAPQLQNFDLKIAQRNLRSLNETSDNDISASNSNSNGSHIFNSSFSNNISLSKNDDTDNQEQPFWETVSIVYTWVNGSDPEYRKLRQQYGGVHMVGGSRDRDSDELKHSLRSLETMMPWFKGPIYIVTPSQPPSWLNTSNPRIHVLHQDSILPPEVSPVFSSFPVEFYLHTIPNLSDIFIYLNDDYMFGRPISPNDLFTPEGYPKLFFEPRSNIVNGSEFHDLKQIFVSALMHTNGALNEAYGKTPRKFIKHAPYVFYRKVFQNIINKWGEKYIFPTLQHKFRHSRDVLPTMLHHYYVINEGPQNGFNYEMLNDIKYEQDMVLYKIVDEEQALQKEFDRARQDRPKFFAVNDVFEKMETQEKLKKFLGEFYPKPSSFELQLQ